MKIKSISKRPFSGKVYNLETSPNHTYFANGIGVHNCYTDAKPDGKHAGNTEIYYLAKALGELKVFEVALGGGEVTLMPNFISNLSSFRDEGIVPNFTTRNLAWLRDPKQWIPIMERCGSFAFSTSDTKEVATLNNLLELNGIEKSRVSVQYVMGLENRWNFESMLKAVAKTSMKMTLLGYKTVGRGIDVIPNNYLTWFSVVLAAYKERECPKLSVDTLLVEQWEKDMLEGGVPKWMFHTQEGKFSMFIDAVKNKMGPSSYCAEKDMFDFDGRGYRYAQQILEAYAKF